MILCLILLDFQSYTDALQPNTSCTIYGSHETQTPSPGVSSTQNSKLANSTSTKSPSTFIFPPTLLLLPIEMPREHLVEKLLAVALDHVSMARDDRVKVPLVNRLHAVVEAGTVLGDQVPCHPPHPSCVSLW
ncbi:hypothetical protein LIA77_08519 [Sarocladium implicatum]|nr:hypothetical protein LIA77_08519 [Sarocladium implicatum]